MNVIVDPLFVSIAERNIKMFDIVPLFYDANKAQSEIVSEETLFGGLKRAHDYSSGGITSIGEISNMLTRLWNKDKPDIIAAAWLAMFNNLVIDAAKSGTLSHYDNYPKVAKRINKAIGGKKGLLPYWFQFSKNGRRDPKPGKKPRKYLEKNNSTMNRICAAFDDIKNINLHNAEIPPFNWQMFLSEPCLGTNMEMCAVFCEMDNINMSNVIESKDFEYASEREKKANYDLLASMITEEMTIKFGPLENSYPYLVKFLFGGTAINKAGHKQMFWRVYGNIALENIKRNMENYSECDNCGMKYPSWVEQHECPKVIAGHVTCIDCGRVFMRKGPRQQRCELCQESHSKASILLKKKQQYQQKKEEKEQRIISLQSRLEKK